MTDIVERLRKPVYCEDLMRRWDRWRKQHKEGFAGSATRDEFESIIDVIDEERAEAAAEIERLRAELLTVLSRESETTKRYDAKLDALEARLAEAAEEIERAAGAFELLALADDAQRNGVTPSVRAAELRAILAKMEGR